MTHNNKSIGRCIHSTRKNKNTTRMECVNRTNYRLYIIWFNGKSTNRQILPIQIVIITENSMAVVVVTQFENVVLCCVISNTLTVAHNSTHKNMLFTRHKISRPSLARAPIKLNRDVVDQRLARCRLHVGWRLAKLLPSHAHGCVRACLCVFVWVYGAAVCTYVRCSSAQACDIALAHAHHPTKRGFLTFRCNESWNRKSCCSLFLFACVFAMQWACCCCCSCWNGRLAE